MQNPKKSRTIILNFLSFQKNCSMRSHIKLDLPGAFVNRFFVFLEFLIASQCKRASFASFRKNTEREWLLQTALAYLRFIQPSIFKALDKPTVCREGT